MAAPNTWVAESPILKPPMPVSDGSRSLVSGDFESRILDFVSRILKLGLQSRKVSNLPFYTPPFDWQIRSLLIVPKRPLVYLPKANIHLEIFINFSNSIVSTIDVRQRFDIRKLQNLKAGEVHIMRVPV